MRKYYLFIFILTINTFALIVNYEDSENLESAMKHCPSHAQNRDIIDREKAVKFYLSYLAEYPDTINRPKVLCRIGMLYAQYENKEKGLSRDFEAARDYFKKAIAVDPDFICYETIVARTNLASIAETREKRFEDTLETCKWLESISDGLIKDSIKKEASFQKPEYVFEDSITDKQKQEIINNGKLTATEMPQHKSQIDRDVKELKSTINTIKKSTETNLLYGALSTSVPEASLKRIINTLKGAEITQRASQELGKLMNSDLYLPDYTNHDQNIERNTIEDFGTKQVQREQYDDFSNKEISKNQEQVSSLKANGSVDTKESWASLLWVILGVISILGITIFFFLKKQ
jgi:hypothetical protein